MTTTPEPDYVEMARDYAENPLTPADIAGPSTTYRRVMRDGKPVDAGDDDDADPSRRIYRMRPSWVPRFEPDVFVPADLALLTGPTSGVYDPPVSLYWQPGTLDFADPLDRALFYASALPHLATAEVFAAWINAHALAQAWPRLRIPSRVRTAWETVHPSLRQQADDAEGDEGAGPA